MIQLAQFASTTRTIAITTLATMIWGVGVQPTFSQNKQPGRPPTKPEEVTLTTRDGVYIHCAYYPGPESKQTVPMILIHDWDESKGELYPIAAWMQRSLKASVLVPDLRGHGRSTKAEGYPDPIDREKLKGRAIEAMALDIEACKSFLLKKNNEGKLNIEQLGILGNGFGACLALKWAIQDWSVRPLPTFKQGQDVKALILVSPTRSFRGITINPELKKLPILRNISALTIVGGEDTRARSDAQRIHKTFERAWGDTAKEAAPFAVAETSLQSTDLLKAPGMGVDRWMHIFISRRLIAQADRFLWTDRTSPLQ